ncbi:MAG: tetratricopeptide repeat protein [Myxococcota bacterium]
MISRKLGILVCIGALACGGGSGSGDDEEVATTTGGTEIRSAGGAAVTVQAHNHWTEGLQLYARFDEAGWNPQNCASAIAKFEEANEAQGGAFAEALYMAGLVAETCNDGDKAREFYRNSLRAAEAANQTARRENRALPGNGPLCKSRVALALMDQVAGNRNGARQAFQRAVRDDPQCTSGYVNLAIMQREAGGGQEEEALRNLRRALAIESDYLPAFNQMALLYYNRGLQRGGSASLDLAEVVCRQAQLIDADYAPIYNTWGLVKIRKGDVIEALRFFQRAIALDDNMFEGHMNFGQVTLSFRGYQDARRSFAKAVELNNGSYEAHLGLGAALRGLEQFAEAQAEYERAIQIEGARPDAHFNLGVLYQDYMGGNSMNETIGNLERAKGFYNTFIQRAGSNQRYAETVESVRNRCRELSRRRRRGRNSNRRYAANCRPGRLQVIDDTVSALREAEQMQREAEQMQREAEAQQRQMEQQQQQEGGSE